MYALNLDSDGRILSVTYSQYATKGMSIVDELPEGDVTDYKYVNGEFVYDPLPKPEPVEPEPSTEEILNVLLGVE